MELDIYEAIIDKEIYALTQLARKIDGQDTTYVAVGIWKGHSASIIGARAKEVKGHLYCIDHWKGNEGTGNVDEAKDNDIYGIFEHNMKVLELWDYITPVKIDSLTASLQFNDRSVDFLFLDADHRYTQFKQDLEVWIPKMKKGGIICGHDCEQKYIYSHPELKERLTHNKDMDFDGNYHAGIIMGLHDYFGDDYSIVPDTRIWFKEIQ